MGVNLEYLVIFSQNKSVDAAFPQSRTIKVEFSECVTIAPAPLQLKAKCNSGGVDIPAMAGSPVPLLRAIVSIKFSKPLSLLKINC